MIFRIYPKVNAFLNENSQEVFNEVKPEISKQVGQLVLKVMNDALSKLTEFLYFYIKLNTKSSGLMTNCFLKVLCLLISSCFQKSSERECLKSKIRMYDPSSN